MEKILLEYYEVIFDRALKFCETAHFLNRIVMFFTMKSIHVKLEERKHLVSFITTLDKDISISSVSINQPFLLVWNYYHIILLFTLHYDNITRVFFITQEYNTEPVR